jgi:hypothetical protein
MSNPELAIPRRDLLAVWKVIEKLVVSTDRIAGAHEFLVENDEGETVVDEELQREHDRTLAEYLEELTPELLEARNALLERLDLDADEAVHLTRNVIQYWSANRPTIDYDGDRLEGPDITLLED